MKIESIATFYIYLEITVNTVKKTLSQHTVQTMQCIQGDAKITTPIYIYVCIQAWINH